MKAITATIFFGCALLVGSAAYAQDHAASAADRSADDTGVNKRDRGHDTTLPTDQPNNKSDIEFAAAVRKAIVKDKSLSSYAHNVKIIAQDGTVTLKGPVRSEEEKQAVEAKAAEAAGGADKIKSELEVSSKPTTKSSPNKNQY